MLSADVRSHLRLVVRTLPHVRAAQVGALADAVLPVVQLAARRRLLLRHVGLRELALLLVAHHLGAAPVPQHRVVVVDLLGDLALTDLSGRDAGHGARRPIDRRVLLDSRLAGHATAAGGHVARRCICPQLPVVAAGRGDSGAVLHRLRDLARVHVLEHLLAGRQLRRRLAGLAGLARVFFPELSCAAPVYFLLLAAHLVLEAVVYDKGRLVNVEVGSGGLWRVPRADCAVNDGLVALILDHAVLLLRQTLVQLTIAVRDEIALGGSDPRRVLLRHR